MAPFAASGLFLEPWGCLKHKTYIFTPPVTMRNGVVVLLLDVKEPWKVSFCRRAGGQEAGGEEAGEEEIGGQEAGGQEGRGAGGRLLSREPGQECRRQAQACTGVSL